MTESVALAFESGGDPHACTRTLAALRAGGTRATVFLDGRWAEANPALLREIVTDEHELGNHAYSHPDLIQLADEQISEELARTEAIAVRLTGRSTKPWFRPPFQRLDDRVRKVAAAHGYRCLSRDALDGAHYVGPSTAQAILQRSLQRATNGAVLTYHLHNPFTAEILPELISRLRESGVRLGTISELPTAPEERMPLHPDFGALEVDPGYLRMHRAVLPPQMINLLAMGADALAPVDQAMTVGRVRQGEVQLLTFTGHKPMRLPRLGPCQVACLLGDVVLAVIDGDASVCTALARPGDILEVRDGWAVQAEPAGTRAILLVMG